MTEPQVRVTSYAVSCIPEDHVDARSFTLRVERRRADQWVVTDGFWYFNAAGRARGYVWRDGAQEPTKDEHYREISACQDAWKAEYWLTMDAALAVAKQHAPLMKVMRYTVADCLADIAEAGDSQ